MGKMSVIVVAAGSGKRFGGNENKIFARIENQPLFLKALQLFVNREDVCQTILVVSPADMQQMKSKFGGNLGFMGVELVEGGAQRYQSVANGLKKVKDEAAYVAVHDAVRICVAAEWIDNVHAAAVKSGAACPVIPVTSTVKRVDGGIVGATVPREGLFIAQTPQIFRKDVLKAAYDGFDEVQKNESTPITDDAQLVTASGFAVTAVEGDARNIKITTRGDLTLAGALLKSLPQKIISRSGAFEEAKW